MNARVATDPFVASALVSALCSAITAFTSAAMVVATHTCVRNVTLTRAFAVGLSMHALLASLRSVPDH